MASIPFRLLLRWLSAVAAVVAAAAGIYLFLFVRPLAVEAAKPEADVAVQVFGLGTVEARILSKVGFQVGGTLGELHADHGDRVAQGTVLARLHSGEQQAKLAEARAKLAQADAFLRQTAAQVRKAEAVHTQRRQINERRQVLVKRGTVSEEAAQDSQAEADVAATENVAVVLDLAGRGADAARARAEELLDYLEVGHRKASYPAYLSGGEAQRVVIARALANRPRIILADEPTAALDSERAAIVMDLLRKVARDQQAAIMTVTHDEKILGRLDRIFRLRDGRLVDS